MAKIVRCPQCGGPSIYEVENPYRPFCSERCKLIDLGDWASEAFSVPAENQTPEDNWSEEEDSEEDLH